MTTTTASASTPEASMTLNDILKAVEKLKAQPHNDKWILVSPEGQMYKGRIEEIAPILMSRHPMLQPYSLRQPRMDEMKGKPNGS